MTSSSSSSSSTTRRKGLGSTSGGDGADHSSTLLPTSPTGASNGRYFAPPSSSSDHRRHGPSSSSDDDDSDSSDSDNKGHHHHRNAMYASSCPLGQLALDPVRFTMDRIVRCAQCCRCACCCGAIASSSLPLPLPLRRQDRRRRRRRGLGSSMLLRWWLCDDDDGSDMNGGVDSGSGTDGSSRGPGGHRRRRRWRDVALVAFVSVGFTLSFAAVLFSHRRRLHYPSYYGSIGGRGFGGGVGRGRPRVVDALPIRIGLYDASALSSSSSSSFYGTHRDADVGGWLYDALSPSKPFPVVSSLKRRLSSTSAKTPDYGEIEYKSISTTKEKGTGEGVGIDLPLAKDAEYRRKIDYANDSSDREKHLKEMSKQRAHPHVPHRLEDDDSIVHPTCRRPSWFLLYNPNCNAMHELDLRREYQNPTDRLFSDAEETLSESYYVSHGFYRDVWFVEDKTRVGDSDAAALKTLRWKHTMNIKAFDMIRKDALVMERLTKSPRIVDVYGHCAYTVATEVVPIEVEEFVVPDSGYAQQIDLEDVDDVDVRNSYTVTEKLDMALQMAQSIADLHGFDEGVIVHDDVQLCQWLRTADGRLKLGDFNRAEVMLFNEEEGTYCKYANGKGYGNYRAPEEFAERDLDEKIDIFSFGNNLYGLLTGLWPFYENEDDEVVQNKVIDKKTAYIDPRYRTRSYGEGKLVEIMEKCWTYDPDKRISIFEVVKLLEEAVAENTRLEAEKKNR